MYFCMNDCACHSEPAIGKMGKRARCYTEGKTPPDKLSWTFQK